MIPIAHRPNIMEVVDKVLVLNRGQEDPPDRVTRVFAELSNRAGKVSQMPRLAALVVKESRQAQEVKEA